jgi:hypothetical protein
MGDDYSQTPDEEGVLFRIFSSVLKILDEKQRAKRLES